jgi:GT2 family glycosyltransferase
MISYSILIVTHNQKESLRKILDILARNIKDTKIFEVVIADDCSGDGTEEYVKRMRFPIFMKYVRSPKNVGRSIIRNNGFEKTVGRKVIFLDGDMVPGPEFIDVMMSSWREFPDAVILGSWRYPPQWKESRVERYLASRGRLAMRSRGRIPGKYFNSGCFSIDRELFRRMSGFDPAFEGWKGEDTDLGLRLEKANVPIIYDPDAACFHHHRKSLDEMLSEFERFGRSSYRVLLDKHPDRTIFEKGWMLGLPDPGAGKIKKAFSKILLPLRSKAAISILRVIERSVGRLYFPHVCYDWLFYSCLAKGYRGSLK